MGETNEFGEYAPNQHKIVGEVFTRNVGAPKHGRKKIMFCAVLEVEANSKLEDDTFYLIDGVDAGDDLMFKVSIESAEKADKGYEGLRIDQVMTQRRWRIPRLKGGQYLGKPSPSEIERDYF